MEKSTKHLDDITEIRQIMERSTRFLSLSGWSGIVAGIFAILGGVVAYLYLGGAEIQYDKSTDLINGEKIATTRIFLIADAIIVLTLALLSALIFSARKAKRQGEKIWSPVTKRLLFQMAVPLITGGILSLILIWQHHSNLIASITLIFYGVALVNTGRYTNREIVWLGISEIIMGLSAAVWQESGLFFWVTGFGLFHIIYGITHYFKYERKAVSL